MLRELKIEDAPKMLEWMHDEKVICGLQPKLFKNKTLDDCKKFIVECKNKEEACHMAIVNDQDEYLGTVSLKMIDLEYKDAEFAIVLRSSAQRKGHAAIAMEEIMGIAFEEYKLKEVYWNVLANNAPAIHLYEKCGYSKLENVSDRRKDRAPKKENGEMEEVIFFHATIENI